jgi:hypothetical protein|tara:strand:- start:371 stop:748 length:378 start_codon:yes stop_codon:yes gene_type:complete
MSKKMKITELEWSEPGQKKGEEKSLSIDFKKEMITTFEGRELTAKDHNEDVMWVITNYLNSIREKKDKFQFKLDVTEETRIPIKDGYKLLEPLVADQRERFTERVKEMGEEITELIILEEIWQKK